jgi:hypothetical protein
MIMKPSSLRKVAWAIAWFILFTAFVPGKQSASSAPVYAQNAHYYYYLADDDSYDAYNTVGAEIAHLQVLYGTYVNTNPFGGTLVARGYINDWYPHTIWPASYLYAHF